MLSFGQFIHRERKAGRKATTYSYIKYVILELRNQRGEVSINEVFTVLWQQSRRDKRFQYTKEQVFNAIKELAKSGEISVVKFRGRIRLIH